MKNETITVSALSSSRTFASREELAKFVREIEDQNGSFNPLEFRARQVLAGLDSAMDYLAVPADKPDPKPPTPFDDRIAELEREEEEDEAQYMGAREAWLSRLQELRAEVPRRFHGARDNSAKLSRFQNWVEEGQAQVAKLEFAFQKADRKLQRKRAALNALKIQRDRWRQEQGVRIHNLEDPSQPFTLTEYTALMEREAK